MIQMRKSTQTVRLRALTEGDLDRVLAWHNDRELYGSLGGRFRYVSREAETEWFQRISQAKDQVNLAICLADSEEHIGNIYLRGIDWVARNCELHAFIAHKQNRGQGYGSSAVQQIVRHAFEDLGLARVYLHVLCSNAAAIAMYEKCGFAREGVLKRHAFKAGAFEDVLVMARLRE